MPRPRRGPPRAKASKYLPVSAQPPPLRPPPPDVEDLLHPEHQFGTVFSSGGPVGRRRLGPRLRSFPFRRPTEILDSPIAPAGRRQPDAVEAAAARAEWRSQPLPKASPVRRRGLARPSTECVSQASEREIFMGRWDAFEARVADAPFQSAALQAEVGLRNAAAFLQTTEETDHSAEFALAAACAALDELCALPSALPLREAVDLLRLGLLGAPDPQPEGGGVRGYFAALAGARERRRRRNSAATTASAGSAARAMAERLPAAERATLVRELVDGLPEAERAVAVGDALAQAPREFRRDCVSRTLADLTSDELVEVRREATALVPAEHNLAEVWTIVEKLPEQEKLLVLEDVSLGLEAEARCGFLLTALGTLGPFEASDVVEKGLQRLSRDRAVAVMSRVMRLLPAPMLRGVLRGAAQQLKIGDRRDAFSELLRDEALFHQHDVLSVWEATMEAMPDDVRVDTAEKLLGAISDAERKSMALALLGTLGTEHIADGAVHCIMRLLTELERRELFAVILEMLPDHARPHVAAGHKLSPAARVAFHAAVLDDLSGFELTRILGQLVRSERDEVPAAFAAALQRESTRVCAHIAPQAKAHMVRVLTGPEADARTASLKLAQHGGAAGGRRAGMQNGGKGQLKFANSYSPQVVLRYSQQALAIVDDLQAQLEQAGRWQDARRLPQLGAGDTTAEGTLLAWLNLHLEAAAADVALPPGAAAVVRDLDNELRGFHQYTLLLGQIGAPGEVHDALAALPEQALNAPDAFERRLLFCEAATRWLGVPASLLDWSGEVLPQGAVNHCVLAYLFLTHPALAAPAPAPLRRAVTQLQADWRRVRVQIDEAMAVPEKEFLWLVDRMTRVHADVQAEVGARHAAHLNWLAHATRAQAESLELLAARAGAPPGALPPDVAASFRRVNEFAVADVITAASRGAEGGINARDELDAMSALCRVHGQALVKIYEAYARVEGNVYFLAAAQCVELLRDARVICEQFSNKNAVAVFARCSSHIAGKGSPRVIAATAFVTTLVRLAHARYSADPVLVANVPGQAEDRQVPLHECFELLVRALLLRARRSDKHRFAALVQLHEVQNEFSVNEGGLRRSFAARATLAPDGVMIWPRLTFVKFAYEAAELGVVQLPEEGAAELLQDLYFQAQAARVPPEGEEGVDGLLFDDFLEAVAALADVHVPNPYVAFEVKLRALVERLVTGFEAKDLELAAQRRAGRALESAAAV